MQLRYLLLVVLVLGSEICACAAQVSAQDLSKITFHMSDAVLTCSNWLSKLIASLCNNEYTIVKRQASPLMDKLVPEDLRKHLRQRVLRTERWRRVRRQVASQCCSSSCTVYNIITYCPDDAKLFTENPDLFELFE